LRSLKRLSEKLRMNKHLIKYLTHKSESLRDWVKDRIQRTDQRYDVIEGTTREIPEEHIYVLGEVNISVEKLSSLNRKVVYCEWLDCSNNRLESLPELPVCKILFCWNNRLTQLPELPACKILYCSNNLLTQLPDLPKCRDPYCTENPGYPFKAKRQPISIQYSS